MLEAVLEFKAKVGGWYAGTAVFEGPYLRVHFEHFPDEEDEKWLPQRFKTPQDVRKMVRPASQPMQDSQCSGLRRGMFLCVACRSPGTELFEYYDAKLEQFHRSPHKRLADGQECCMCFFEVEWLSGPLLHKRQFVTCGDICLRTPGDIEDDPVLKEYIAAVKSLKVSKSLSCIGTSQKDASLLSKNKKMVSTDDERMQQASKGDNKEHFVSAIDQKDFKMTLQCGESSKQMGDINMACTDELPLKKVHLNTPPGDKIPEPSFSCRNGSPKAYTDVIEIDSDKEEEPGAPKNVLPANITEAFGQSEVNEGKKSNDDKIVHDDQKFQAVSPIAKPLDEISTHGFSGISKQCSFSGGSNVAGCSCLAVPKHCFKNKSCECEAVGFIPISSCHITNMCGHSHRKCKHSSRRTRKTGHACAFSATSQVCSQADNAIHSQVYEAGGDTKESIKDNKWEYSCEGKKGLFDYLLLENLEKDILPSGALKAVRKVSSGALTVYIWPSLEYETTRRGYIFYQDSESAEAAYLNFSAGKFVVTSSKGRPWIIRRHKLDHIQPYDFSAVGMFKEENEEAGKEEVEDKDLLIIYKGTEEYTKAVGKQKLFMVQQEKLHWCFEKFINEEKELEALT